MRGITESHGLRNDHDACICHQQVLYTYIIFRTQDWFEKYRLQEIASAENSIGVLGFAVVVIH